MKKRNQNESGERSDERRTTKARGDGKEETQLLHKTQGAHCSKAFHYMYSCELVRFCPTIMAKPVVVERLERLRRRMTEHYVIVQAVVRFTTWGFLL